MLTTSNPYNIGIAKTSRVLMFMPHPDDEAVFCTGFILALNRFRIPIKIIIINRGEASTLRFGLKPSEDLATARDLEQKRAFAVLGVKDYQIENIPDGKIENSEKKVKQIINNSIRDYQPTHLVTLEPDGIYGHPDHVALSKFISQSSNKPIKILYATVCPNFILPRAKHMAKIATIRPIAPEYELKLSPANIWVKLKALYAHGSQFRNLKHTVGTAYIFLRNKMLFREYFTYMK